MEIPRIDSLPDSELDRLNGLLPWSAFVVDKNGRRFGDWFSADKRSQPETIPDPRIIELDRRVGLANCHVLELGCFEGIHTAALCDLAQRVTAIDGRIENVAKTLVRCGLMGRSPDCFFWDVETDLPAELPQNWDVLHHVGVLYHLADPVGHLQRVLPKTAKAVLLDTHIAPEQEELLEASLGGFDYRYFHFAESSRENPFAGLGDHARWLPLADLERILREHGFEQFEVLEQRDERCGARVCIYAARPV